MRYAAAGVGTPQPLAAAAKVRRPSGPPCAMRKSAQEAVFQRRADSSRAGHFALMMRDLQALQQCEVVGGHVGDHLSWLVVVVRSVSEANTCRVRARIKSHAAYTA